MEIHRTALFRHTSLGKADCIKNTSMSSNNASLEAAATERKARLAKLAALKRKQPEPEPLTEAFAEKEQDELREASGDNITKTLLSGRNYDAETRGPKLGFEQAPIEGQITLEQQASEIARIAAEQTKREEEEAAEQPIDLFKLQPKKPNWDLKMRRGKRRLKRGEAMERIRVKRLELRVKRWLKAFMSANRKRLMNERMKTWCEI